MLKTKDLPFVFIKLTHICEIGLLNVFYRTLAALALLVKNMQGEMHDIVQNEKELVSA
jgi:hypothetical protein